jgi:hypothetical protein
MQNNVTEGAIVQHLAKLRSRRVAARKHVPPALRRGGGGAAGVKGPSKQTGDSEHRTSYNRQAERVVGSSESKKRHYPDNDDDDDDDDDTSEEEYGVRRRPAKRRKRVVPNRARFDDEVNSL